MTWGIPKMALAAAIVLMASMAVKAGDMEDSQWLLAEARSLNRLMERIYSPGKAVAPRVVIPVIALPSKDPLPFLAEIEDASRRYRIPKPLIAAVIKCESDWNPTARSPKGALGLMQVLPRTAMATFGVRPIHLWDPETNIQVGTAYLRLLAGRYRGNASDMVAAYNAGPTRVDRGFRLPMETRLYRRCVGIWHERYARILGQVPKMKRAE